MALDGGDAGGWLGASVGSVQWNCESTGIRLAMVTTKLSLADYLSLEDELEGRYEFVDGELIEMPPESPQNVLISLLILQQFLQILPLHWVRGHDRELVVSGRVRGQFGGQSVYGLLRH